MFFRCKQQASFFLAEINNDPRIAGKSFGLCFIVLGDVFDGVREEVSHIEKKLCLDCDDEVVNKFKHVSNPELMSTDGGLFGVWHVFSSLITYQKRDFSITCAGLLAHYPHFFHV